MHEACYVEGSWKTVMDWYQPRGDAERGHQEKDSENIAMQGDEDPKLFSARAEGKLNVLAALGIHKLDRKVVRLITRRLPSEFYEVKQRTTLLRPCITRSEIEKIVRASCAHLKTLKSSKVQAPRLKSSRFRPLTQKPSEIRSLAEIK